MITGESAAIRQNADPMDDGSGEPGTEGTMGAICGHCNQGMRDAESCSAGILVVGGRRYRRRRETVLGPSGRCGYCGVLDGGVHHLGCDLERCPRCRAQLISCGCLDQGFRVEAHARS